MHFYCETYHSAGTYGYRRMSPVLFVSAIRQILPSACIVYRECLYWKGGG